MRPIFLIGVLILFAAPAAADTGYLYKTKLVQAAPGKLLDLIELYKSRVATDKAIGDESPFWMRHSQGDRWDLLLLYPMGSYSEYYSVDRIARRKSAEQTDFDERLKTMIAWQEDIFVYGPPLDIVRKSFADMAFFHVEIFQSLAGKHSALQKEREMENAYLKALNRPEGLIFVRDQGAAWDIFTIGIYRNLKHYAESADIQEKDQQAAARKAGFDSPAQIGPYLRTLISIHHDTLCVAIK